MKKHLLSSMILSLLSMGASAQSVTMANSTTFYYDGDGMYSCVPDYNNPISVNGTYIPGRW